MLSEEEELLKAACLVLESWFRFRLFLPFSSEGKKDVQETNDKHNNANDKMPMTTRNL
jgi:hypothetical protein